MWHRDIGTSTANATRCSAPPRHNGRSASTYLSNVRKKHNGNTNMTRTLSDTRSVFHIHHRRVGDNTPTISNTVSVSVFTDSVRVTENRIWQAHTVPHGEAYDATGASC
jgi:hypothetical protein